MIRVRNLAWIVAVLAVCFGVCSGALAADSAKTSKAAKTAKPAKAAKPKPKAAPPAQKPEPAPSGTLTAVPAEVHFDSTHSVTQIGLFFDETPAKAANVTKAAFVLKGYMFAVTQSKTDPAVITVATNPNTVEDGSYTLEIAAGGQTINVEVYVSLNSGVPVSERTILPARLEFDPTYKKGSTLEYKLEGPLDADYIWTVNGKVITQGPGELKLVYTFEEVGPEIVRVSMKAPNGAISESVGRTEVVP